MQCKKWLPLGAVLLILAAGFYFQLYHHLNLNVLKAYYTSLQQWKTNHYTLAVLAFVLMYILFTLMFIPGAMVLKLMSGWLFGIFWGTFYTVLSATIGASLLFMLVNKFLKNYFSNHTSHWLRKMEQGFNANAFHYLLTLRLLPLLPFWLITIMAVLFGVRLKTFILATLLGVIPTSFIYASIGNGLSALFNDAKALTPDLIFIPSIFLALIGIAMLALLPVFYKLYRHKRAASKT